MGVAVLKDTGGRGVAALNSRLRSLARSQVLVGVPRGPARADGASMALVAATVEFGRPEVKQPERPFLREGIRSAQPRLRELARNGARAVTDGVMEPDAALGLLGVAAAGEIKAYMAGPHFAPNAPATIAKKGSDQPTIDTGALRASITHVVERTP